MQHPDEGTIHSWLDGALSAEEAAQVQAHVADCPECAAAVAEARGFIAASSRILTALDHVPRGVVPAAPSIKLYNRPAWRAAAAVLVVAVGSLVVVRNGDHKTVSSPTMIGGVNTDTAQIVADSVGGMRATVQIPGASPASTQARKPQATPSVAMPIRSGGTSGVAMAGKPTVPADFSGKSVRGATPSDVAARERARDTAVDAAIGRSVAAAPPVSGGMIASPQPAVLSSVAGATMLQSAAARHPSLKVVDTSRVIGAKVTLYEVAPGDTVTLTETLNVQLNAVTTTLPAAEPQARRAMQKSAATAVAQAASPSPIAPPLRVDVVNGVTTISWPDATSGNMLRLSGRMPVERLREIKLRIERERAAAAAKKKP